MTNGDQFSSCCCNPCACTPSVGPGHVGGACVPRPCFFNGQLITADDLNAMMWYWRRTTALLTRFAGGWGVFGGMSVNHAPGAARRMLETRPQVATGPYIMAGTKVEVSSGLAVDVGGNLLPLCAPTVLDLSKLPRDGDAVLQDQACGYWFRNYEGIQECSQSAPNIVAREYWLVAEHVERAARPVPRYSGGGPCDPAPTCDFSRLIEEVDFRLVRRIPEYYLITGDLCERVLPIEEEYLEGFRTSSFLEGTLQARVPDGPTPINRYAATAMVMDEVSQAAAAVEASQPGVVLARVLMTSSVGALWDDAPDAAVYTIVQPSHPMRRVAQSAGMLAHLQALTWAQSRIVSENYAPLNRDLYVGHIIAETRHAQSSVFAGQTSTAEGDVVGGDASVVAGGPSGTAALSVASELQQGTPVIAATMVNHPSTGQRVPGVGFFNHPAAQQQTVRYLSTESQAVKDVLMALHNHGLIIAEEIFA